LRAIGMRGAFSVPLLMGRMPPDGTGGAARQRTPMIGPCCKVGAVPSEPAVLAKVDGERVVIL
jgi:hypothetical protein